jgi:hypothetical protein
LFCFPDNPGFDIGDESTLVSLEVQSDPKLCSSSYKFASSISSNLCPEDEKQGAAGGAEYGLAKILSRGLGEDDSEKWRNKPESE